MEKVRMELTGLLPAPSFSGQSAVLPSLPPFYLSVQELSLSFAGNEG